jgi:hypothetical protein
MKRLAAALFLAASPALAAHQDWTVRHQPDRFMDRVMMEAWADADKGAAACSFTAIPKAASG